MIVPDKKDEPLTERRKPMQSAREYNPRQILVPLDMSELSDLSLKYAHVGAQVFDADITVLNAMHFEYPRYLSAEVTDRILKELKRSETDARRHLAEHVRRVLGEASRKSNINYQVVDIDPARAILRASEDIKADLIVMGTHGYSGLKHWMLGSVTEKILHLSKTPVFTIRQKINGFIDTADPDARPEIKHILCPCNLSPSAAAALQTASSLAEQMAARLVVLFCTDSNDASEKDRLAAWVEETLQRKPSIDLLIRHGEAAEQTIAEAGRLDSDLIVIGICHRPFGEGSVVGRTTEKVARYAPVPVLAIPYFM